MKWIPVTERLPKEEGAYLCTVIAPWISGGMGKKIKLVSEMEFGKIAPVASGADVYSFNGYGFGERWSDGIDNLCEVIAWCELPQPYEGETA